VRWITSTPMGPMGADRMTPTDKQPIIMDIIVPISENSHKVTYFIEKLSNFQQKTLLLFFSLR
jgi:hypothetical protein